MRPPVERPLEGSWSDGAIIPGPARCRRWHTIAVRVDPFSPLEWRERDGAVGTPRKPDPRGYPARRTRLCGGAGGGTCAGHRGAVEFLATFHEQRRSRRQQGATVGELKDSREPLGNLISTAQEELDRLYKVVREAGYTILFCDSAGVAIEHRGEGMEASEFQYWGTWLGGVWAEEIEGTNGIGTCIAEERPVTIHRTQHFRSRHMNLSCSGAPIFGVDARLLAVLDVSAIDPQRS